jgi:hypothetical protein
MYRSPLGTLVPGELCQRQLGLFRKIAMQRMTSIIRLIESLLTTLVPVELRCRRGLKSSESVSPVLIEHVGILLPENPCLPPLGSFRKIAQISVHNRILFVIC